MPDSTTAPAIRESNQAEFPHGLHEFRPVNLRSLPLACALAQCSKGPVFRPLRRN
jgi:hypothetical protein